MGESSGNIIPVINQKNLFKCHFYIRIAWTLYFASNIHIHNYVVGIGGFLKRDRSGFEAQKFSEGLKRRKCTQFTYVPLTLSRIQFVGNSRG